MLKWFNKLFSPYAQSEDKAQESFKEFQADNSIEQTEELVKKIVDSVHLADVKEEVLSICLWVNDEELSAIIAQDSFKQQLKLAFDDANLVQFGASAIEVKKGIPSFAAIQVSSNKLYISIKTKDTKSTVSSENELLVHISCVEGTGSLAKRKYVLDSSKKTTFYIGRGQTSIKDGFYRVNDIVIKSDETNSDLANNNSYVSRSQANIIIKDSRVFLQAMKSGCRTEGGSSTKIIHNQEMMELRDTRTLYPIVDGDMIECGKRVLLRVKIQVKEKSKAIS